MLVDVTIAATTAVSAGTPEREGNDICPCKGAGEVAGDRAGSAGGTVECFLPAM